MVTPDPNMRVSNAEREAILARLHAATEEGRLDLDEFADRSRQAYEARTYGEVERLLADLPEPTGTLAVPSPPPAAAPELRFAPVMSSAERKGDWLVPPKIAVDAKMSSVKLDCRHASIASSEVEIALGMSASSLELVLPAGAYAVDEGTNTIMSSIENKAPHKGAAGVRFVVSGRINMSSVTIRHERRFLWWRW